MSSRQLLTNINREIETLNDIIDLKVIRGVSYRREAKRHKMLLGILSDINSKLEQRGSFSFMSFLL